MMHISEQQCAQRLRQRLGSSIVMFCMCVAILMVPFNANAQDGNSEEPSLEETLRVQYEELLKQIRASMPDLSVDTPKEATAKRTAVRRLLGQHQQQVMALTGDLSIFGIDYVQFQIDTAPRLSGRVLRVGANQEFANIDDAIAVVQKGDSILLSDGGHQIGQATIMRLRGRPMIDVQIVGNGPEQCTLGVVSSLSQLVRVRMRGLTLECANRPYFALDGNGSVQVLDCVVTNYNSGAGGSNGISGGDNSVWLFERTTFNGGAGRAARSGSGGNALDMRGDPMTYVRQCQFIDNVEISRTSGIETYDSCVAVDSLSHSFGVMVYGSSAVSFRQNQLPSRGNTREFKFATDDRAIIDGALGKDVELDTFSREVVNSLRLDRRPTYWIGLLRHPDAAVRREAAIKIRTILAPEDIDIPEQPGDVNDLSNLDAALEAEKIYAEVVEWYEFVKDRLVWDEVAGRWMSRPAQPKTKKPDGESDESR